MGMIDLNVKKIYDAIIFFKKNYFPASKASRGVY